MASTTNPFISSLHHFCTQLSAAYTSVPGVQAQPEAQLTAPVSELLKSYPNIQVRSEVPLPGVGRPDLGVLSANLLTGYVELKPPGKGANPAKFNTPHDRQQWAKFKICLTCSTRMAANGGYIETANRLVN